MVLRSMSVRNDRYSIIITHSFVHTLFSFLYFVHKCLFGGLEMKDNSGTCETYWQFFFFVLLDMNLDVFQVVPSPVRIQLDRNFL